MIPIPIPHFVHRHYPIKVNVQFSSATKGKKGKPSEVESDDDVIVSISNTYFAQKNMD